MFFAVAALALAAFGTVKQMEAQKDSKKAQQRALAEQERRERIQQSREKREQAAEARRKAAQATQMRINRGLGGGSSAVGGEGSLQTQFGSNIGFMNQMAASSQRETNANYQLASARSDAQLGGSIANLGMSLGSFGSSFGGKTKTTTDVPTQPIMETGMDNVYVRQSVNNALGSAPRLQTRFF